jgi:hypothetical protein
MGEACGMCGKEDKCRILMGEPERKNQVDKLDIDGLLMLKYITKKCDGRLWTGFIWLWFETTGDLMLTAVTNVHVL